MTHKYDPGAADRLLRPERAEEERPRVLLKTLDLQDGQIVLDLGCGPGFYLPYLAEQVAPTGWVVGADLQKEMLTIAQQHLKASGIHNVCLVQVGEASLPFPDHTFDVVTLAHTLHELHHPVESLKEVRRVLAPQGIFWIWDWDRAYSGPPGPPQEERLSPEEAKQLLLEAGFHVEIHSSPLPARFFIRAVPKKPKKP